MADLLTEVRVHGILVGHATVGAAEPTEDGRIQLTVGFKMRKGLTEDEMLRGLSLPEFEEAE